MNQHQHPLDLLPEFIRIKCQAGVRMGRYVAVLIAAVVLVIIVTTHMRFELDRARERLARAEEQANLVLELEAKASLLTRNLEEISEIVELEQKLQYPFEITRLFSTLINQLPESVTVERLELDSSPRATAKARLSIDGESEPPRRESAGEVSGFAATDDDIAELVSRMQASDIFSAVNWDFSRTRVIRRRPAREFRVSFRIDLDESYKIVSIWSADGANDAAHGRPAQGESESHVR